LIKALVRVWDYIPTTFEAIRLAGFTSIGSTWVARKLRDLGMSEIDITYFLAAISMSG